MNRLMTLTAALLLTAATATAQTGAEAKVARGIAEAHAAMSEMRCPYTLERKVKMLADVATESGTLTYVKATRTLTLASATADTTIMTPRAITTANARGRNTADARRNAALRQMLDIVGACFTGDFAPARQAGTLTTTDGGATTTMTFTPKDKRALRHISSIELTFGNDDYGLRQMTVWQPGGDFLRYTFGRKKTTRQANRAGGGI